MSDAKKFLEGEVDSEEFLEGRDAEGQDAKTEDVRAFGDHKVFIDENLKKAMTQSTLRGHIRYIQATRGQLELDAQGVLDWVRNSDASIDTSDMDEVERELKSFLEVKAGNSVRKVFFARTADSFVVLFDSSP